MAPAVVRIEGLPATALEAAAAFHADHLATVRHALESADSLVIVLPYAPHDHAAWRRAMVQDLARAYAPRRVNAVTGDGAEVIAIAAATAWLEHAPGVTGQLLDVDGQGAGNTAYSGL